MSSKKRVNLKQHSALLCEKFDKYNGRWEKIMSDIEIKETGLPQAKIQGKKKYSLDSN